jgi:hypothetical protein
MGVVIETCVKCPGGPTRMNATDIIALCDTVGNPGHNVITASPNSSAHQQQGRWRLWCTAYKRCIAYGLNFKFMQCCNCDHTSPNNTQHKGAVY